MLYRVHLTCVGFEHTTLVVIGTDFKGNCKFNYHTITSTTPPKNVVIVYYHILILDTLFYWLISCEVIFRKFLNCLFKNHIASDSLSAWQILLTIVCFVWNKYYEKKQLQSFVIISVGFYWPKQSILTMNCGLVQNWFLKSVKTHIDL